MRPEIALAVEDAIAQQILNMTHIPNVVGSSRTRVNVLFFYIFISWPYSLLTDCKKEMIHKSFVFFLSGKRADESFDGKLSSTTSCDGHQQYQSSCQCAAIHETLFRNVM